MELSEYITVDEVKRVCKVLGLRDWTALEKVEVLSEEAEIILAAVNIQGMNIDIEDFRLQLIGIGDRGKNEIIRTSRYIGQQIGYQPSRAAFSNRQKGILLPQETADNFRHGLTVI